MTVSPKPQTVDPKPVQTANRPEAMTARPIESPVGHLEFRIRGFVMVSVPLVKEFNTAPRL